MMTGYGVRRGEDRNGRKAQETDERKREAHLMDRLQTHGLHSRPPVPAKLLFEHQAISPAAFKPSAKNNGKPVEMFRLACGNMRLVTPNLGFFGEGCRAFCELREFSIAGPSSFRRFDHDRSAPADHGPGLSSRRKISSERLRRRWIML
jgi:hypothetical protein